MANNNEQILNDFFTNWCARYKIMAPAQAGLEYADAHEAWQRLKHEHAGQVQRWDRRIQSLSDTADFHQRKAERWLRAYQDARCKNVGDYTRMFVRRPRLRGLIQFLMRL